MKEKNLKIQTHSVITDLQKAKERSIFQFSQIVCVGIKKKPENFRSQTFSRNFAFFSENKLSKKMR